VAADLGSQTLSHTIAGDQGGAAWLFQVLCLDQPLAPARRLALDGVDLVELGRGPTAAERGDGGRRLGARVPDRWMSTRHAVLRRVLGAWVIIDEGSKNGTLVRGAPVTRSPLADGDLLELGNTLFRFRLLPRGHSPAADGGPSRILGTLLPGLAEVEAQLLAAAASVRPLLLQGGAASGAVAVARAVHDASGRSGPCRGVGPRARARAPGRIWRRQPAGP
jgi:hypothetical protein